MSSTLIKNARIVNEGKIIEADLRISGQRISHIDTELTSTHQDQIVEANGQYLLPGMIDDQVHFREPGLTYKGSIATESRAAVAGGITSFLENVPLVTDYWFKVEHQESLHAHNAVVIDQKHVDKK